MPSRRGFLAALGVPIVLWAGQRMARAQGLDRFTSPSVPCKENTLTPAVPADGTYKPKSPARTAIADGASGQKLVLTGVVAGLVCGPIKGAQVDFWQADDKGTYDMTGVKLRGHQLTDALGVDRLETIVPGVPAGRARHLNARVQMPGKPALVTRLFFPDDPSNARDKQFRPELALKVTDRTPAQLTASFNFILDA